MKPLAVDLYCGLGGWSDGFLAEGYDVIGFDIEARPYPGQLVLQDVLTIHGRQFKDAAVIVGSSPCQEFSYRAMPWKRAKALPPPYLGMKLFKAQLRIRWEASEAAGRVIPLVIENVQGAERWVGGARWHFGSFYLWGDVPALIPYAAKRERKMPGNNSPRMWADRKRKRVSNGKGDPRQAEAAKIPFELARHVARVFKPEMPAIAPRLPTPRQVTEGHSHRPGD